MRVFLFNITLDRNVELKNNKHLKKIYEISSLGDFVSYSNLRKKLVKEGQKFLVVKRKEFP